MAEGVAVVVGEGAFSRGADVGEDQWGRGFGGNACKVDAVPGGGRGREDAGFRTEFGGGIVAYAEAVS